VDDVPEEAVHGGVHRHPGAGGQAGGVTPLPPPENRKI
jgi:hypothetical protein